MPDPKDCYVICFDPHWAIKPTPVYGPFTEEVAREYKSNWVPIIGYEMKVVRVVPC